MADGETTRPVQSGKTAKVEELDGFKFVSFEQGELVNSFVTNQRKRVPKRSFAGFGLTTLSVTNDTATRLKKRNRKDDKRVIVDRVDGFTFVSAFTLNDFDEYDKNPVKHPLAPPTKRKANTKIESAAPKRKAKKPECSTPETSVNVANKGQSNLTLIKESAKPSETVSNTSKKNVSPLTKSALVRLKKINVSSLNQHKNSPMNKQINNIRDSTKDQKNRSFSKAKKSINLKVPLMKIDKPRHVVSSNSLPKSKKSKIPHMQIDKLGEADSYNWHETFSDILSDDEDNFELDVCGIDESSSSQFILNNINTPEEITSSDPGKPKNEEKNKLKRKPCRVCCAYPCRIVGAKRIKSHGNQFPSFDVSFTSRCQVHTPGEIEIHDSSQGKVNVCIQTTSTDIRMHLDFARRFPYRAINIVSCQPSLYDDDLKLADNLVTGTIHRCSENHRILEQKRREELHGLYCKLADTLSISKNKASKQWILENARKEIMCLEAKDKDLTVELNSTKSENDEKKKRWEQLAGKPYVAPEESITKVASKSKLLELYEQYRQERNQLQNYSTTKAEDNCKSEEREIKDAFKEEEGELQEREKIKKELQKKIRNSQSSEKQSNNPTNTLSSSPARTPSNNPTNMLSSSPTPTSKLNNSVVCESVIPKAKDAVELNNSITKSNRTECSKKENSQNPAASMQSSLASVNSTPVTASQVGPALTNRIQPVSVDTLVTATKHTSLGPRQIVRPFQRTPISPSSPSTPVIPKIDLTNESKSPTVKLNQLENLTPKPNQQSKSNPLSELSQLLARNPNLATTTGNVTSQVATPRFKSLPPNQSSALPQSAIPSGANNLNALFPTPIAPKPNNSSPLGAPNNDYVIVTMVVRGKRTIFKIPKTAEGLTLMSKLSALKVLSPDTLTKLAAKFSVNQPEQSAGSTASLATKTSLVTTPATPTQWSAVASIPNSSTAVTATCQPVKQSNTTSAVKSNNSSDASIFQPVEQPTATQSFKANNSSLATISQPAVNSGSVGTTSERKPPRFGFNSDVSISEQVKQFNALRPCKADSLIDKKNSIVSHQQKKLIFFDLTSNKKPEAKAFSVTPTSSSINVTLNKLGSITANKVFNRRPAPMRSQNNPPNASFTSVSAPSTSQTNQPKLSSEYHLQRTAPVQVLPKREPHTNVSISRVPMPTTSVHIYPASPAQIPSEEPPQDLPDIPPDIPSDLTRASFSPLETIPQISDSLLKDTCQKDADNANEPGFCVISNVFSLTDTGGTPNSPETTTVVAAVDARVDTNVGATVMSISSDVHPEIVHADMHTTDRRLIANVQVSNSSISNSTAGDSDSGEQLKVKVIQ